MKISQKINKIIGALCEVSDHQCKREQWQIFARTIAVKDEEKEESGYY